MWHDAGDEHPVYKGHSHAGCLFFFCKMDPLAKRMHSLPVELQRIVYRKFHQVSAQSCRDFLDLFPESLSTANFAIIERRTPRSTTVFRFCMQKNIPYLQLTRLGAVNGRRVWKHVREKGAARLYSHDISTIAEIATTKSMCTIRVVARVHGMMREHVGRYNSASATALARVLGGMYRAVTE